MPKRREERQCADRKRGEEKREPGKEREQNIEKETGCPRISLAIFQTVFLQDNGFNRGLIKLFK